MAGGRPLNPGRFTLPAFAAAGARRVVQLAETFGRRWQVSDSLESLVGRGEVLSAALRWVKPRRMSSTQGRSVSLGGMVGNFIIERPSEDFRNLCALLEHVNIGKKTVHGCGTVRISAQGTRNQRVRSEMRESSHFERKNSYDAHSEQLAENRTA